MTAPLQNSTSGSSQPKTVGAFALKPLKCLLCGHEWTTTIFALDFPRGALNVAALDGTSHLPARGLNHLLNLLFFLQRESMFVVSPCSRQT